MMFILSYKHHYLFNKIKINRRKVMPQKDGTGPNKQGSKTGRGQGDCKPKVNPKYKTRKRFWL